MVQKRKSMVNELANADSELIMNATFEVLPPAKREKNLAIRRNTGAPGGWPTSIL